MFGLQLGQDGEYQTAAAQLQAEIFEEIIHTVRHPLYGIQCASHSIGCQEENVGVLANFLDVQVTDVQRVLFDELAAAFDVFTHEGGEDRLAFGEVVQVHL